ncbi:hypothetical protein HNY73_012281 [Argiope bruennichi]|uniref:Uncharacterized protein n=1 Tax=Argiope bruennichi TaxID=94029 RepID=A0A8T0EYV2_ARGBR|nr:hypothetical protein HNY73_012281 [Argiope bruennichi]
MTLIMSQNSRNIVQFNERKYHGSISSNELKIFPLMRDAHRAMQKKVLEDGLISHTYELNDEKQLKIVIRGLPANYDTNEIIAQLNYEGFTPILCHPLRHAQTNTNLPLFQVTLPDHRIFTLRQLFQSRRMTSLIKLGVFFVLLINGALGRFLPGEIFRNTSNRISNEASQEDCNFGYASDNTAETSGVCPTPLCADDSCRIEVPPGHECPTCVCGDEIQDQQSQQQWNVLQQDEDEMETSETIGREREFSDESNEGFDEIKAFRSKGTGVPPAVTVELEDTDLDKVIWVSIVPGCPTPLCADSSCRIGIPQGHKRVSPLAL